MRPGSAAIIAVRVMALWIGIQALTIAIALLVAEAQFGGGGSPLWADIVAQFLIAFVLWSQAGAIARAMTRGTIDEATPGAARSANAHAIAISVVGIILFVDGVTGLIGSAISEAAGLPFSRFGFSITGFAGGRGAQSAIGLVTILIGTVLVVASGDIARSLSRRYPEKEPTVPPQPPQV